MGLPRRLRPGTQWHLYCMMQNIEKLAHPGYVQ